MPRTSSSRACSPNFLILEGIQDWGGFHAELLKTPIRWEDGYVIPPTGPGLGVELDEEVASRHPVRGRRAAPGAAVHASRRQNGNPRERIPFTQDPEARPLREREAAPFHIKPLGLDHRREAGRAEIGAERVLEQLHDHRRPRGAAVLLARAGERLLDQRR